MTTNGGNEQDLGRELIDGELNRMGLGIQTEPDEPSNIPQWGSALDQLTADHGDIARILTVTQFDWL